MKPNVIILGLAVVFFWGLWGFLYKLGISKIGIHKALLWSSITYGTTNILIISFLLYSGIKIELDAGGREIIIGSILATFGSLLFLFSLEKYEASIIIPLTALYPAISTALSIFVLGEKITLTNALGIVLAILAGMLLAR